MIVTVKSKDGCPFCVKAKEWLAGNNIAYVEERYDDANERQKMYDRLGLVGSARTVPQIVVSYGNGDDRLIQGYDRLIISGIEFDAGFD